MVEMAIQKEIMGGIKTPARGPGFGMKEGLVEAPARSGKTALSSIVRLSRALESGRIPVGPQKYGWQEPLKDVLEAAAKEAVQRGAETEERGTPSLAQLQEDARKLATLGRENQTVLRKELGEEVGSRLNTAICLQIHELLGSITLVIKMEEIARGLEGRDLA